MAMFFHNHLSFKSIPACLSAERMIRKPTRYYEIKLKGIEQSQSGRTRSSRAAGYRRDGAS